MTEVTEVKPAEPKQEAPKKQSLMAYVREKLSLPEEVGMGGTGKFAVQWRSLTDEDKQDLMKMAHAQGDTYVEAPVLATK